MPVEFIGFVATNDQSEIHAASGPVVDPDHVVRVARAHEEGDFDRALIAWSSASPESLQVAAWAAAHTERLSLLVAHRPGFVFPTVAARNFATLDQFSRGRAAIHTITGGSDAEQRRDGDYLTKDERYERTDEYLEILRRTWSSEEPFGYSGKHYRFEDAKAEVKPFNGHSIPVYFGGSSPAAYRVGGKHADVYALWGEPLKETADQISSVNGAAAAAGRADRPRISVSFRPILGATEEKAWERAHDTLERVRGGALGQFIQRFQGQGGPQNAGSQRLLAAAEKGELHDRALWTPLAAATGAAGNSTALVGTPETVAAALLDYYEIGVTTFLIRGYDPLPDAVDYGREVIPLVRAEVARRERAAVAVAAGEVRS